MSVAPPPAPAFLPEASPAPLPGPTAFDQKMAALDTRAAEVLGGDSAEPIYTLELDTAIDAAEIAEAPDLAEASASEPEPLADADADLHYDDEPIAADLALPAEPSSLPPAVEEALDLDLNVEPEPAGTEPDLEPEPEAAQEPEQQEAEAATGAQWDAAPAAAETETETSDQPEPETDTGPLEDALGIEAMSDEELEAALATELAVMEQDIAPPDGETEVASDFTSMQTGERREPTLDEPANDTAAATASTASRFNELEEVDEEALVHLSSAALAEASPPAPMRTCRPTTRPPATPPKTTPAPSKTTPTNPASSSATAAARSSARPRPSP